MRVRKKIKKLFKNKTMAYTQKAGDLKGIATAAKDKGSYGPGKKEKEEPHPDIVRKRQKETVSNQLKKPFYEKYNIQPHVAPGMFESYKKEVNPDLFGD